MKSITDLTKGTETEKETKEPQNHLMKLIVLQHSVLQQGTTDKGPLGTAFHARSRYEKVVLYDTNVVLHISLKSAVQDLM
jgi:hypothetical protein